MLKLFTGTAKLAFLALLVVFLASCSGIEGDDGTTGTNGHSAVWSTAAIGPSEGCPNGGIRIDIGLDLDDDGTLDAGEITGEPNVICDGTDGAGTADGPTVLNVTPAAGAADVSVRPSVEIAFSEAMNEASFDGAFLVEGGEGGLDADIAYNSSARTVTLTFDKQLSPDASYTIFVLPVAEDLDGNPLQGLFISQFTTGGDMYGPSVAGSTPTQGTGIGSGPYPEFCFNFDEPVNPAEDHWWNDLLAVNDGVNQYGIWIQEPEAGFPDSGVSEICFAVDSWAGFQPGTTLFVGMNLAWIVDASGNAGAGTVSYEYEVVPTEITGDPTLESLSIAQGGKFSMRIPVSGSAAYAYVSVSSSDDNDYYDGLYGERRAGEDFILVEGELADLSAGEYYVYDIYVEDPYGWSSDNWWADGYGDEFYQDDSGLTDHAVVKFTVTESPDLSIGIADVSVADGVATVTVEVANLGPADAAAGVPVALAVNLMTPWFVPTTTTVTQTSLVAGGDPETIVFTVNVSMDRTNYFEVVVDPDNLVAEPAEWNNSASTSWTNIN